MGKGGPALVLRAQRRDLLHDLEMGISISFPPSHHHMERQRQGLSPNQCSSRSENPSRLLIPSFNAGPAAEGLENPELAEDVLADLFFTLYVHDNSIDPTQLAATWLKEQGSWPRRYLNLQDF